MSAQNKYLWFVSYILNYSFSYNFRVLNSNCPNLDVCKRIIWIDSNVSPNFSNYLGRTWIVFLKEQSFLPKAFIITFSLVQHVKSTSRNIFFFIFKNKFLIDNLLVSIIIFTVITFVELLSSFWRSFSSPIISIIDKHFVKDIG